MGDSNTEPLLTLLTDAPINSDVFYTAFAALIARLRISPARGNRLPKFKQIHLHILRRLDMA